MNIIGIQGALNHDVHDSGCTLFVDGKHIVSISEERLSRIKYDGSFPYRSIDYCLSVGNIEKDDIDIVVYSPHGHMIEHDRIREHSKFMKSLFTNAKIWSISHHLCHAASTVFTSPFNSGTFLTIDGAGSVIWDLVTEKIQGWEKNSIGYFDKDRGIFHFNKLNISTYDIKPMRDGVIRIPCGTNGFGAFYQELTVWIYAQKINAMDNIDYDSLNPKSKLHAEGKVMGLSSYGEFDIESSISPYTKSTEFSKDFFDCDRYEFGCPTVHFFHNDVIRSYLEKNNYTPEQCAYYLQKHYENAIVYFISELRKNYLTEDVCFAGGSFLNISANTLLKPFFKNIHIPPFTDDTGIHFGAAAWASYKSKERIEIPHNIALLGKSYTDKDIENAINLLL